MSYPRTVITLLLLAYASLTGQGWSDEANLLPQTGVLILRGGRVLQGHVLRVGDRYIVGLNDRDEVSVPIEHVEMHCVSLQEAYQQKRAQLPQPAKVADHLQLGDWCLRYDLTAAAAEQLMAAQQCDPLDPANRRFETRLRLQASQRSLPPDSVPVAAFRQPQVERDELLLTLPPGSVEQFTNTVQPLLINRCGAGNCHGPTSSSKFRLVFPAGGYTLPRSYTQSNLKSALEFLDTNRPAESPLLLMATQAHGTAETAPLVEDDVTQIHHLASWVYANLKHSQTTVETVKKPDALLLQTTDPIGVATMPRQTAAKGPEAVASDATPPPGDFVDPAVQPAGHFTPAADNETPRPLPGIDPFDPEIFNRRYFGSGQPAASAALPRSPAPSPQGPPVVQR